MRNMTLEKDSSVTLLAHCFELAHSRVNLPQMIVVTAIFSLDTCIMNLPRHETSSATELPRFLCLKKEEATASET